MKLTLLLRVAVIGSVLGVLPVVACSSDPTPIKHASDGGGTDGGSSSGGDARTRPYPNFDDDVMPVFIANCSLTACHGSKQSNLNIYIPNNADAAFAELSKTSPTSGLKFIEPGDPTKSYVMIKMDGKQGSLSTQCDAGDCGTEMPPDVGLVAQDQRDTIRAWITAGAKR